MIDVASLNAPVNNVFLEIDTNKRIPINSKTSNTILRKLDKDFFP
jgi:hypothetical protein